MWFKSSKISNCVTKCVENHWHYRWGKKKARRKVTIKKVSSVTASNISAFYLNFISFLVPTPPDIHERLILPHFYFIHTKKKKLNVDESVSLGNGYKEVSYLTIRKGHIVWDEKKRRKELDITDEWSEYSYSSRFQGFHKKCHVYVITFILYT